MTQNNLSMEAAITAHRNEIQTDRNARLSVIPDETLPPEWRAFAGEIGEDIIFPEKFWPTQLGEIGTAAALDTHPKSHLRRIK